MKIMGLIKEGNSETMYSEDLNTIGELMGVAIKGIPGSRECNGLFTLWACQNGKKPVRQVEFETVGYWNKREWTLPHEYDEVVGLYGDDSCRKVLSKAITAAHEATCEFFPLRSVRRVALPVDQRANGYPLTSGYYIYRPEEDVSGPIVMVLRTSMGVFYAGFIANAFDYTSVQNSVHFSVYLFSALANIISVLGNEDDYLMNLGVAKLLEVPAWYPEAFRPNASSSLICFDNEYCLFRTLKDVDKQMSDEFLVEVERRRLNW